MADGDDEYRTYELKRDLKKLLNSEKFSDVEIETEGGSRIFAHQNILSARSSMFRAMLADMLKEKTKCIKIPGFSSDTVKNMMTYIYTSEVPELSFDGTVDLFRIADQYGLATLKNHCIYDLLSNLNPTDASKLLILFDTYQEFLMKEKVLQYIRTNASDFTDETKFDCLNNMPHLLKQVITAFAESYSAARKDTNPAVLPYKSLQQN